MNNKKYTVPSCPWIFSHCLSFSPWTYYCIVCSELIEKMGTDSSVHFPAEGRLRHGAQGLPLDPLPLTEGKPSKTEFLVLDSKGLKGNKSLGVCFINCPGCHTAQQKVLGLTVTLLHWQRSVRSVNSIDDIVL